MRFLHRAIEQYALGRPAFAGPAGPMTEENGRLAAASWADWLIVEMEHQPFDVPGLAAFMRGYAAAIAEAGKIGPGIGVTLPIDGTDAASVRANVWMVKQVLATGVHGVTLCHAESPDAVRAMVAAMRYSDKPAAGGLEAGRRGHGGQAGAARIWGMSQEEYIRRADLWPASPDGALLLGIKVENPRALAQAQATLAVPGVGFAEWGPADMSLAAGTPGRFDTEKMRAARAGVRDACFANGVVFQHHASAETIADLIDEGARLFTCNEQCARIGRAHWRQRAGESEEAKG